MKTSAQNTQASNSKASGKTSKTAQVLPEQPRLEHTPAPPRLRRFASMMYEGVLLFAVVFLAGYLFDTLTQSRHALMLRGGRQVWLFLAIGAYFMICWRRSGQTLPMKAWHIRLLAVSGQPAGLGRLVLRYLLMWVLPLLGASLVWGASVLTGWNAMLMLIIATPFLTFIPTWFFSDQQFLHDRLAGTRLVNVQTSKNP
ncbi:RDD family protein [Zwartia sp.]|uniref:RDD family protein n=1 Tax=Zwartia sp. TaxID=2978004 RepID=UPI002723E752|nr:RDD family protein [Zwartia sp.]MDO9025051.1 RDD family protein [Zwartia sp.]